MSIPDMVMEKRPKGIGQGALLELSGQAGINLPPAQRLSRGVEMEVLVAHNSKPYIPHRGYRSGS